MLQTNFNVLLAKNFSIVKVYSYFGKGYRVEL